MTFHSVLALASAYAVAASNVDVVQLPLAVTPPSSTSDPVPNNFQSFSIELAFWADYAGRSALVGAS
jgi:hypothetical protein